ncbi:MAG: hypothetical protein LBP63_00675 [Prevotellaceae bacterium]|nr:hypothetical protein [Prevotellaceae bacterium]
MLINTVLCEERISEATEARRSQSRKSGHSPAWEKSGTRCYHTLYGSAKKSLNYIICLII